MNGQQPQPQQQQPDYAHQERKGVAPREDTRWLFDYTLLHEFIRARIAGGKLVQELPSGELKVKECTYPYMNKRGVETTMSIISGFITGKVQATTNLDRKEVYAWCKELWETLAIHFAKHMHEYDLKKDTASVVIRMIVNLFHTNLAKSIGGIMIDVIRGTETVTVTKEDKDKKRFWFW